MYETTLQRASLLIFSILLIASQQTAAQAGKLDPTFGKGGIVTTDFGDQNQSSNVASANAVIIQPDGKILVCGGVPGSNDFPIPAVARYETDGRLDTSFGNSGIATIPSIENVLLTAITLQSDGKIVASGANFVVRYSSHGVLDSTFGTGGIASLGNDFIGIPQTGVLVQPDGKIVLADRFLLRFLSDGQFDTGFGPGARRERPAIQPLRSPFLLTARFWSRLPFREPAALSLNTTRMAVSTPVSELVDNWPALELLPA